MVKAAGRDVTHGLLSAAKQLLREAAAPETAVGNVESTPSAGANPEELEGEMRVRWMGRGGGGFAVSLNDEAERSLISARELDGCLKGWHVMPLVALMR
jgi:hypothetical protein